MVRGCERARVSELAIDIAYPAPEQLLAIQAGAAKTLVTAMDNHVQHKGVQKESCMAISNLSILGACCRHRENAACAVKRASERATHTPLQRPTPMRWLRQEPSSEWFACSKPTLRRRYSPRRARPSATLLLLMVCTSVSLRGSVVGWLT